MTNAGGLLKIIIASENLEISCDKGSHLSQIIDDYDLPVYQPCGGNATCGKCLVRFSSGAPQPTYNEKLFLTPKEIDKGYRLSCQSILENNAIIEIPEYIDGMEYSDQLSVSEALVSKTTWTIHPPDFKNLRSDEAVVAQVLPETMQISPHILKQLPLVLRESDFYITGVCTSDELIHVTDAGQDVRLLGLALDIGSTTLALSLIDLESGHTLALKLALNPQCRFGDDLITRLNYIIQNPDGESKLSEILIAQLNKQLTKMCHEIGVLSNDIYCCVVSGNSVMNHLFLGVNPKNLGFAPFTPVFSKMQRTTGRDCGLKVFPEAAVHVMPNIGGYVGGDIISDMLCAGFGNQDHRTKLLIDIGTNCEVVLEYDGGRLATSSPAGPALEGACIRFGMRAEAGAIYDIDETGHLRTIRDKPVRGICGSGLFHLIAAFYNLGLILPSGIIKPQGKTHSFSVQTFEGSAAVLLNFSDKKRQRDVYLTQADVREFQLARSAIISAWKMLCQIAGILPQSIEEVYIAGAFGNFIRADAAINLGLFPLEDMNEVHFIGNGSLEGGRLTLTNSHLLDRAAQLAETTRFVELGGNPDFQEVFVENMTLS